ncbi:MAG: hypothetical protein WCT29_03280 [Candidatus Paceibacterota bacterium]|jgi:hypothetical protein
MNPGERGPEGKKIPEQIELRERKIKLNTLEKISHLMPQEGGGEGQSIQTALEHLGNDYSVQGYGLPDKSFVDDISKRPEDIKKIMEGEDREEVYLVIQDPDKPGEYTRVFFKKEEGVYKRQPDAAFHDQTSSKLLKKDKILFMEQKKSSNS